MSNGAAGRRSADRPAAGALPAVALAVALLLALVPLDRALAQDAGGAIEGRVTDGNGQVLDGVAVVVTGDALLGRRTTVTDARGHFRVEALPIGRCAVMLSRVGLHPSTASVRVVLGASADMGMLVMVASPVPVTGVNITGNPVVLRRAGLGASLPSRVFRALPSDRDYQSIVTLAPHATTSYAGDRANLAGTSGPESNYYVDGANVVEPPGNGRSTSLPSNFIQEVDVRAGGYQAEFGGAGGGIVNAVTASGGNTVHGEVFAFGAHRLFTTSLASLGVAPRTEDFSSWDAGAGIGGPIVRDRLWYYAAWDPTFEDEKIRLPGFGTGIDRRRVQRFAAKLTARPEDRTQLALVMVADPTHQEQVGGVAPSNLTALGSVDPVYATVQQGGGAASLRATRTVGTRSFVQADAAVNVARYSFTPRTFVGATEPLYTDARTGYVEGGVGSLTDRHAGRWSGRLVAATQRAGHALKAGAGYEDEWFRERLALDQIARLGDALWQYTTLPDRSSRNHIRSPHAFAQDAWDVSPRLRLDAGLRWSGEWWMASGGSVGQRIADAWQPRFGATWILDRPRTRRVFASWGRFVQRTRLNVPGFFLQDTPSTYLVRWFDHDPRQDPSGGTPVFAQTLGHQAAVAGLRPATFDETQAGGDAWLAGRVHVLARGVYRTQRSGIAGVLSPLSGQAVYGNPGRGELAAYPGITRIYRALELTLEGGPSATTTWQASYVLASLDGNYEGYWGQSAGVNDPLGAAAFASDVRGSAFGCGPLPSDRTHQLKLRAARPIAFGLSAGTTLWWASGTPISELGSTRFGPPYYVFLSPRGSRGRTPALYDLAVRLAWQPALHSAVEPRLLADVYHVGNPRRTVVVDEVHYRGVNGSGAQVAPNPGYGGPLLQQPPVAWRFGVEVRW